ncbi:MFS transporter [Colletotrichum truncatum]|uniref:MFS transporter n=1 Tax=Colletotrichum truncatum TaxID=5467 RepID=A0ACC3ZBP9_COLTU|nr:MFS transporter [Colletotrichum truncatum]KAF6783811.1 MFS transporter [Colletotrichum truncatum]
MYAVFSTKKVFLASTLFSAIGSIVCAVAKTSHVFIFGRVLAGLGCAGMQIGTTLLTASVMPLYKRSFYGGIIGTGEVLAVMAGPLVAGGIAKSIGWPWCFWINLPVDAVIIAALAFLITEKKTESGALRVSPVAKIGKLDLPGGVLVAGGTASLLVALNSAGARSSWTEATVLAPLLVSIAVFVVAAVDQHKKKDQATFPTRLMRNRHFVTNMVWLFMQASSQLPTMYYLPIWIQGLATDSVLQASIGMVPILAASIVGAIAGGLLAWATHYLPPGTIAGTAIMSVGSGLLWSLRPDSSMPVWIGFGAIFGLGTGFTTQQAAVGAQAELNEKDFPAGMSALAVVRHVSAAIFIAVDQTIFLSRLSQLSSVLPGFSTTSAPSISRGYLKDHVTPENFSRALDIYNKALTSIFLVSMILGIVGFLTAFVLPWTSLKKPHSGNDDLNEPDSVALSVRHLPKLKEHSTDSNMEQYRHTIALDRNLDERGGQNSWLGEGIYFQRECKSLEHIRQRCKSL